VVRFLQKLITVGIMSNGLTVLRPFEREYLTVPINDDLFNHNRPLEINAPVPM
jgi:hypothetical protein